MRPGERNDPTRPGDGERDDPARPGRGERDDPALRGDPAGAPEQASVSAIVVSYGDPSLARGAIESLLAQTHPPIEVLAVDNTPPASASAAAAGLLPPIPRSERVRLIRPGANIGYTRAVNLAARSAAGEWLLLLNPDAIAERPCVRELLAAVDGEDVAVVGAQVLLPDGRVNAGENPVNIAGLSWSGGYGSRREHGLARDVAAVSGAALLVRRSAFERVGGLSPHFFMYVDDTDLCWRMRLSGGRVRFAPSAVVVHDYEFVKGPHKWFYLERNRYAALLTNLNLRTLVMLAPLLAATELATISHAIANGWLRQKLRAWRALAASLPELRAWRSHVQSSRTVSDYRVMSGFVGAVESDLLDRAVPALGNRALELYRMLLLAALRRCEGAGSVESETSSPAP
ncbi:MAG TPA: glycosyltransferase family 2 protein [Solirubrobacteraceae bacterium]|nr:glycosyltransferase family 2 protein [Solirubrobacteraceae bacterium]